MIYLKEDEVVVTSRPEVGASAEYRERLFQSPVFRLLRDKMVALRLMCDWSDPERTGWYFRLSIGSLSNDALSIGGVPQAGFCSEFLAETSRFPLARLPNSHHVLKRWTALQETGRYAQSFGVGMLQYLHVHVPMKLELDFEYWAPAPFRVHIPGGDPIPGMLPLELKLADYFYEKSSVDD